MTISYPFSHHQFSGPGGTRSFSSWEASPTNKQKRLSIYREEGEKCYDKWTSKLGPCSGLVWQLSRPCLGQWNKIYFFYPKQNGAQQQTTSSRFGHLPGDPRSGDQRAQGTSWRSWQKLGSRVPFNLWTERRARLDRVTRSSSRVTSIGVSRSIPLINQSLGPFTSPPGPRALIDASPLALQMEVLIQKVHCLRLNSTKNWKTNN